MSTSGAMIPTRHRYVHGGFTGTETRFSMYLPPPDPYEGRFFQHITPVPDSEHLAQHARGEEDKIGFSIASGAYFLETNGGGVYRRSRAHPTPPSRHIAPTRRGAVLAGRGGTMYGEHRPYGYAYGGSGGGYRTIGGAENTTGVWDGCRSVRDRLTDGHPEHVHRSDACAASPATNS